MKRILYLLCLTIGLLFPKEVRAQYAYEPKDIDELMREMSFVDSYDRHVSSYIEEERKTGQILFFVGTGFAAMNAATICYYGFSGKKPADDNMIGSAFMGLVFSCMVQEIGLYHWINGSEKAAYYGEKRRRKH